MVALHLIIREISPSLGSLFGLGMVSHVVTHLLCIAHNQNTTHSMPCNQCRWHTVLQHTNLKFNITQWNIVCTYRPTQWIR